MSMFGNGRKTIGVVIFNTSGEFQNEICVGMEKRSKELGYNLAIYASYGCYGENPKYHEGELAMFDLPDYENLDGLILVLDTLDDEEIRMRIVAKIKARVKCPVVSLRKPVPGFHNILIDEANTMEPVIRHVIEDHGKKDIAFMTGFEGRFDAELRLECFRKIMEEHGYPVGEHRYFYGDFWKGKGKDACDWFAQDGKYPEAILCANDHMALAVIDELVSRGIQVPDDVLVTGYDGVSEGEIHSPSLTTVNVDFTDMAYRAVDIIHRNQDVNVPADEYVSSHIIPRRSCGCRSNQDINTIQRRCQMHRQSSLKENLEMQFSFLSIAFAGCDDMDQISDIMGRYIYNLEGVENYFLCLRDDLESGKDIMVGFTDKMHARVILQNRGNQGVVDYIFDKNELLPKEFMTEEPQCYYFYPIHFLDRVFGYEALNFAYLQGTAESYSRWTISVSNGIEGILEQKKMNDLINELENMYIQDVLTGLYNRRGFEKYARMQFSKARAKETMICVIGIDMDGLKPINDIYGHHEGDSALRAVGYAIQEAAQLGQIAARIGGDEYEVIFPCDNEEEVIKWCETFEQSLENFNQKSLKPYNVYASWGYKVGVPKANDTIESYMNESDDIMYHNKVINKTKRNEALR